MNFNSRAPSSSSSFDPPFFGIHNFFFPPSPFSDAMFLFVYFTFFYSPRVSLVIFFLCFYFLSFVPSPPPRLPYSGCRCTFFVFGVQRVGVCFSLSLVSLVAVSIIDQPGVAAIKNADILPRKEVRNFGKEGFKGLQLLFSGTMKIQNGVFETQRDAVLLFILRHVFRFSEALQTRMSSRSKLLKNHLLFFNLTFPSSETKDLLTLYPFGYSTYIPPCAQYIEIFMEIQS